MVYDPINCWIYIPLLFKDHCGIPFLDRLANGFAYHQHALIIDTALIMRVITGE